MSLNTGNAEIWNEDIGLYNKDIALLNKTHWSLANCFMHSKLDFDKFKEVMKDENYPESYKIKTFPKVGKSRYVNFWDPTEIKEFFKNYYANNLQGQA